jgi:hypothetical protein
MTKEAYFEMCELLGSEPRDEEIPVELGDFPDLVQQTLSIYSILKDSWDPMGGNYLGKELSILPTLLDCYNIESKDEILIVLDIIQYIDLVRYKLISSKQKAPTSK